MKTKNLLTQSVFVLTLLLALNSYGVNPVANFSLQAGPYCTGVTYTINDLSTNSPTSWSYTIQPAGGFGPPAQPTVTTVQNPTVSFPTQGTYTITLIVTNSSGASAPYTQTINVLAGPNANITPANPSTCPGGSVNITVAAGGGPPGGGTNTYNWSTGATTSVITVSPPSTTIYSCVITATNGCSVTRVTTVTIANPTVSIVSTPASICPGTACTLQVTISGGGPKTYTWSNSSSTATITTTTSGVYTVGATNGQGCSGTQTYTLGTSTTLSLTTATTPTVLCSGNSATLHANGAGTYVWSNGSAVQNPTVNPTATTNYTVTGTIGTCTGTAVVTLSVSTTPTLNVTSTPSAVCAGASATLNVSGASSYTWLPTNVNTSSIVVTPSLTTGYSVTGQNVGCPVKTAVASINVAPSPIVSILSNTNSACSGEAIALSAFGATSYSWSSGSTVAVLIVYPAVTTVYSVTGVNSNNCTGVASITVSISDCTGLNETKGNLNGFSVYPNPASNLVNFKTLSAVKVNIVNQVGQQVSQFELSANGEKQILLNDFAKGLYFARLSNDEGANAVVKLIVQ